MKYRIGNRVINAEQIRQVQYIPEDVENSDPSGCFIDTGNPSPDCWDIVLRGHEADAFLNEYGCDAVRVV